MAKLKKSKRLKRVGGREQLQNKYVWKTIQKMSLFQVTEMLRQYYNEDLNHLTEKELLEEIQEYMPEILK